MFKALEFRVGWLMRILMKNEQGFDGMEIRVQNYKDGFR